MPTQDPTLEQQLQAQADLAMALLDLCAASADNHRVALCALLTAYSDLAEKHPRCTHQAGRAALVVGGQLIAGSSTAPASASIH